MASVVRVAGYKIYISLAGRQGEEPLEYESTVVDPVRLAGGFLAIHSMPKDGLFNVIAFNIDTVDGYAIIPIAMEK